jgi:hypothetical protein
MTVSVDNPYGGLWLLDLGANDPDFARTLDAALEATAVRFAP